MYGWGDVITADYPCETLRLFASVGAPPPQVTYMTVPGMPMPVPDPASMAGLKRWIECTAVPPAPEAAKPAPVPEPERVAVHPGFSLSAVPWWGWAAAAGALLFMKGGR